MQSRNNEDSEHLFIRKFLKPTYVSLEQQLLNIPKMVVFLSVQIFLISQLRHVWLPRSGIQLLFIDWGKGVLFEQQL